MKRIATFILLLPLLVSLCACTQAPSPEVLFPEGVAEVTRSLREGVELPEISARYVSLHCPLKVEWTLINAEGKTLHHKGGGKFSGTMRVAEKYPPGLEGFPPISQCIRIPASSSFAILLDASAQSQDVRFTIYDMVEGFAENELHSTVDGSGISTIIIDTLGIEVRGTNLECTVRTQAQSAHRNISLNATEASYMSVFVHPSNTEAILDTDGRQAYTRISDELGLVVGQKIHLTDGQPLKLTNLQAEDMALIEAVPYED